MSLLNPLKLLGRGVEVVTLDTVAKNPAIVDNLNLETMRLLMSQLAMAQGALRSRWFIVSTEAVLRPPPQAEIPDRMLKVDEAAMRIGIAHTTLYRNADDYPFTRRPRPHSLRFSERGIEEWLREKRAK